ncbi:GntR family transcriptional regulator [Nesterenkonia jeotgali]|uniref:DNA-binding transcriptional regulator YhcF (GntR family) n=1 Tax=Nesterenkonia jeotgali TaxID=317018 RepID=A0A839FP85_9MICC|nr:GntR family transcriptional regulator [Nesterenkonia jeotgali]MBA8921756.1 DNA-binding transcriptional regulator YhcF (GntR family) [Nesterenkonia jeotgali]
MDRVVEEGRALFVQIAEQLEAAVLDGSLAEGERAPSTNELASFHRINPATAAKGINLLVDRGILLKRRGLGMFVAPGAREILTAQRRAQFAANYLDPVITEGRAVGLSVESIIEMLRARA